MIMVFLKSSQNLSINSHGMKECQGFKAWVSEITRPLGQDEF